MQKSSTASPAKGLFINAEENWTPKWKLFSFVFPAHCTTPLNTHIIMPAPLYTHTYTHTRTADLCVSQYIPVVYVRLLLHPGVLLRRHVFNSHAYSLCANYTTLKSSGIVCLPHLAPDLAYLSSINEWIPCVRVFGSLHQLIPMRVFVLVTDSIFSIAFVSCVHSLERHSKSPNVYVC